MRKFDDKEVSRNDDWTSEIKWHRNMADRGPFEEYLGANPWTMGMHNLQKMSELAADDELMESLTKFVSPRELEIVRRKVTRGGAENFVLSFRKAFKIDVELVGGYQHTFSRSQLIATVSYGPRPWLKSATLQIVKNTLSSPKFEGCEEINGIDFVSIVMLPLIDFSK